MVGAKAFGRDIMNYLDAIITRKIHRLRNIEGDKDFFNFRKLKKLLNERGKHGPMAMANDGDGNHGEYLPIFLMRPCHTPLVIISKCKLLGFANSV